MNDVTPTVRLNRFKMLLVASIFLLPFVAALVAFHLGWMPGTKSHGEPILPQRNLSGVRIVMDNGSNWLWRDPVTPSMTLVALSRGTCAERCIRTLTLLRNARITLNDRQDHLRLLHLGPSPAGEAGKLLAQSWHHGRDVAGKLAGFRPHEDGAVSAILVEANGTALVQYRAGFNADGLKDDLHKVVH